MARNEAEPRKDEITAYLSETLDPEEKAAFEAHLATCKECQRELSAQRMLFAEVNKALAFKRKRSIDEQVARFESEVAAERVAAQRAPAERVAASAGVAPRRRHRPRWAMPVGLALAASAAAVLVLVVRPGAGPGSNGMAQNGEDAGQMPVAAPRNPGMGDAGVDGGQGDPSP